MDPEGVILVVLLVVVISSLKIPKGFSTQRSVTKLCLHILAPIPYRSTILDFKLISN